MIFAAVMILVYSEGPAKEYVGCTGSPFNIYIIQGKSEQINDVEEVARVCGLCRVFGQELSFSMN